jgi:hypothetical protein
MKKILVKLSFLVLLTGVYVFAGIIEPVGAGGGPSCSGGGSTCGPCCDTCTCVSNSRGCACVDKL